MPFFDEQKKTLDVCAFIKNQGKGGAFAALIIILDKLMGYITGVIISIGLVVITLGGYRYMTAGGDGGKITTAKTLISTALVGIILALVGWLLLNTISPQFTQPANPLPLATPIP